MISILGTSPPVVIMVISFAGIILLCVINFPFNSVANVSYVTLYLAEKYVLASSFAASIIDL